MGIVSRRTRACWVWQPIALSYILRPPGDWLQPPWRPAFRPPPGRVVNGGGCFVPPPTSRSTSTGPGVAISVNDPTDPQGAQDRPPKDLLLWPLGCELWVVGDEMLTASTVLLRGETSAAGWRRTSAPVYSGPQFTSHLPTALQNTGSSLKAAAGALLDGDGHHAWCHLEVAAASCQEYVQASDYDGLIDLVFARSEQLPEASDHEEAAMRSLECIAYGMECAATRAEQNEELQYPYREQAVLVLMNAAEVLRNAVGIFDQGDYLPEDPRGAYARSKKDSDGAFSEGADDDYHDADDDFDPGAPGENRAKEGNASAADGDHGGTEVAAADFNLAAERLRAFKQELDAATAQGPVQRRALLKRLLRESHPDHNPGREADVLPLFNYAVRMLHISGGPRRSR